MLTRTNPRNGDQLSILGFGCMRLPSRNGIVNEPRAVELIHKAVESGVNYFDTAYVYHAGKSESVLGNALKDGLRDKVKIATKLPTFMVSSLDGSKKIFNTQLSRLKTDYIDYYLLHMLTNLGSYERLADMGVMEWLEELKAKGSIKNIGFSFHGGRLDFEQILKAYDWDFCQIQYNYMDENNQAAKSGLLLAGERKVPVIVMEPLRGGKLVTHLPDQVVRLFKDSRPGRSPAEWGLRWVWNHPEVTVLLSGMSAEEQLDENLRVAGMALPNSLTPEELEVFEKVKKVMFEKTKVPCTACGYCMPCPAGVDIPGCFSSYNDKYLLGDRLSKMRYIQTLGGLSATPANASQCVGCGRCVKHCPQNIDIPRQLETVAREMEGPFYRLSTWFMRKFAKVK